MFFTGNGGSNWHELTSLPTIAVRDMEIQRREGDLVLGTFGRGIYILDDYSPLRTSTEDLKNGPVLFTPRDTWLYNEDARRGWGKKGDFGTQRYVAENPTYGAILSYHLPEGFKSLRDARLKDEAKKAKEGEDTPYPSWDDLRREDREEAPYVMLTVRDVDGNVVNRLKGPAGKGFHQVAWNMRYPAPNPVNLKADNGGAPWESDPAGPMALPGEYSVTLSKRVEGQFEDIAGPERFTLKPMHTGGLVTDDREGLLAFQNKTAELYRAVMGASRAAGEIDGRIDHMIQAVADTPGSTEAEASALRALKARMYDVNVALSGDSTVSSRNEAVPMSIYGRLAMIAWGTWASQSGVTGNHSDSYDVAAAQFPGVLSELKSIAADLAALEAELEAKGAPWTPSRIPEWQ